METYGLDQPLPEGREAAALEIDVIFAEPNHPYHEERPGPLRERARERVEKLFEIKSQGRPDPVGGFTTEFQETMQDATDEKAEREAEAQAKLAKQYHAELEALNGMGRDGDLKIEDMDVREFHIDSLRTETLLHSGQYRKAGVMIQDSFRGMDVPPVMRELLARYFDLSIDNSPLCKDFGDTLILFIYDQKLEKEQQLCQVKKKIDAEIKAARSV